MNKITKPLTALMLLSALTLGSGCTTQRTSNPEQTTPSLSAVDSAPESPLTLASGDALGLELMQASGN